MTDNLLPCPFCGGRAERVDIDEGENTGGSCICCTVCQASGNVEFGRKENFVSNWNRRPICDIAGFDAAYPEIYWHVAKGKITAGEPLYGAIITTTRGTEIGQGASAVSAEAAFWIAVTDAGLAAAPAPHQTPAPKDNVMGTFVPTHRHKKRGSVYQVIAHGRLQVDGDLDMEKVTIYQAEDGTTWVRPDYEFNDGRFEALATTGGQP